VEGVREGIKDVAMQKIQSIHTGRNIDFSSFLLSTFLYQERHVRYKPTLYRPGTKRNGKVERRKLRGDTFCAICRNFDEGN
jgi:hypothetical protein